MKVLLSCRNKLSTKSVILLYLGMIFGLMCRTTPVEAQTVSTWSGGAGNWSDCPPTGTALWDTCGNNPPEVPNGNFDAVINGGPVTATSATIVNLTIGAGGSLQFPATTAATLDMTGTSIVNNGSISIDSGNGLFIQGPTSLTVSGGGTISIGNNSRFVGSLTPTVTLQQPVSGSGAFAGGMALINQNTINATGGTLTMQPASVVNTGIFEASSGGTLAFYPGGPVNFNNTGGIIQALDGGVVQLHGTVYTGGTLTTVGTGLIQLLGDGTLNSLTNTGTIQALSANEGVLQGNITNSNVIEVPSATLAMSGNVILKGIGNLVMSGSSANLASFTGSDSLTSQQLIHGSGTIYGVPFTNQATLAADSKGNTLFVDSGTATNTGTMEASGGGILELENPVDNTGGVIEALAGSTVTLASTVSGGTITSSGTGVVDSQNALLDGTVNIPTNAGKLNAKTFNLYFQGTINNTGTISLAGTSCIGLEQPSTLTGSGKLMMGSTTCIYGSGLAFTNDSTIQGSGSIGDSNPMPITNNGTILANQSSPLIINSSTYGFTNSGKLMVNAGRTLTIQGLFNNLSGTGTLTGGTYAVTGTLGLPGGIVTNAGNITLTGASAEILNTSVSVNALSTLSANATTGILSLMTGQALTTTTSLSNSGKATVGAASSLTLGGSYTQLAGTTTVDGTLTAPSGFSLQKGSVVGKGTIASAVTSSAAITAGDSATKPGVLTVNGSFTQKSTGTLNIAVGGTAAGTFGQVVVSNGVSLAGKLALKLINGFVPAVGDSFSILTGTAVTGTFGSVTGTSINASEHFQVNYNSTDVTVTVVSGP